MEAKEIQIGDWVMHPYYKHPSKILYFLGTKAKAEFEEVGVVSLEPIPLTIEILKKNGFVCIQKVNEEDDEYECWQFSEGLITINYEPEVKWLNVHNGGENGNVVRTIDYYTDSNVIYVHELQHLLRMCHINKDIEL